MRKLASLALCGTAALAAGAALAGPTGETLVSGSASVARPSASSTVITQSSAQAIINWNDFSVGGGQLVQFVQPSASAAILNRVTGSNLSQIDGQIQSNGRVLLVNTNGIVFGPGAQADVGGLIASSLNITDADFNSGHWQFDGVPVGSTPGRVTGNGTLSAASGGFIVLLSQAQMNGFGTINAPQGSILLANGSSIFVDPVGDGLMLYQVTAPTRGVNDGIYNYGPLTADGGRIAIEAMVDPGQAANQISAVINQGVLRAQAATAGSRGEIILVGRGSGLIEAGVLDASGPGNGTVTLRSDVGVGAISPRNLYPCDQNPDPCNTGDGNAPPAIQAHHLVLDGSGRVGADGLTIIAPLIDITTTGYASFSGDHFTGLTTLNATAGEVDLFNSDFSAPNLAFNVTGGLFFGGSRLSGATLNAQASGNLDIGDEPNVPSPATSSLNFSQQVTLTGATRLRVINTQVNTPALNLNTNGIASIERNQYSNLAAVRGAVGQLQFLTSTLSSPNLVFDITGDLLLGSVTLSGGTLLAQASGNIDVGDEPNVASPAASSLSFSQQITLSGADRLRVINTDVDTPVLNLSTQGIASIENDRFASLQALHAAVGEMQFSDTTLNRPALAIDVTGDLIVDGDTLSGGSLSLRASGLSIGRSLGASNAPSSLNFSGPVSIDSSGTLNILDASIQAPDLTARGAGYFSIYNSTLQTSGSMLLQAGADLQFDVDTSPQSTSTVNAGALAARAGGAINLGNAIVTVGTGSAAFGADPGMLDEVRAATPDRVPLSSAPNAAFSAPQVIFGNTTLNGDYLYIAAYRIDFNGPVPITAPANLFVNLRPYSSRGSIGLEQNDAFFRDLHLGVNQTLNSAFPGTTYVFGGSNYDGVIFAGEAGPVDFGSHDAGVFFMTNAAVVRQSGINSTGPVTVLAGLTSTPPEADQDDPKDRQNNDDDSDTSHQVDRVTTPSAAKECR